MSTETDLYSAITGDAGLSALISTRVYPNVLPDNVTLPAIAYRVVGATVIGGVCVRRRVQVDYYATSYSAIKSGRDAIKTLTDTQANWQYIEGPDLYEEDTEYHHQVVDLVIS